MTTAVPTVGQRRRGLTAVISSSFCLGIAVGAAQPLLTLLMERRDVDASVIGANAAMFPIAMLLVGPFLPRLIGRLGTLQSMFLGLTVCSVGTLLYAVFDSLAVWFVLRFVIGAFGGLYWVVSETWMNTVAADRNRGRIMGLYTAVLAAGFVVGPLIIEFIGIEGALPFVVVSGALALAGVPVALARDTAPPMPRRSVGGILDHVRHAPGVMFAGIAAGAIEAALISLLPSHGLRAGFDERSAIALSMLFYAGNLVLQVPIGWLADRIGRQVVLNGCILVTLTCAMILPMVMDLPIALWPLMVIWGGSVLAIYTVSLTLLGERFGTASLAAANTAYVMMYEIGGIGGPIITGTAMDVSAPFGMPVVIALVALGYLVATAGIRAER